MAPADLPKNQTVKKKIDPLFVLFVAVIVNLVLTTGIAMQYNSLTAEVEQVHKLELLILQLQGVKVVPPKPPEKPTTI